MVTPPRPNPSKDLYHKTNNLFAQMEELVDFNPAIVQDITVKEWKAKLRELKDSLNILGNKP